MLGEGSAPVAVGRFVGAEVVCWAGLPPQAASTRTARMTVATWLMNVSRVRPVRLAADTTDECYLVPGR